VVWWSVIVNKVIPWGIWFCFDLRTRVDLTFTLSGVLYK